MRTLGSNAISPWEYKYPAIRKLSPIGVFVYARGSASWAVALVAINTHAMNPSTMPPKRSLWAGTLAIICPCQAQSPVASGPSLCHSAWSRCTPHKSTCLSYCRLGNLPRPARISRLTSILPNPPMESVLSFPVPPCQFRPRSRDILPALPQSFR